MKLASVLSRSRHNSELKSIYKAQNMAVKRGVHGGQRVNQSVSGTVTFRVNDKMLAQGCLTRLRYVTQWTLVRGVIWVGNHFQEVLHP